MSNNFLHLFADQLQEIKDANTNADLESFQEILEKIQDNLKNISELSKEQTEFLMNYISQPPDHPFGKANQFINNKEEDKSNI